MNEIKLLERLEKYNIRIGVFTAEGLQSVDVNVTDMDNNSSTVKMKIADIMFFTEYGTIQIPGSYVLEKSLVYVNNIINEFISDITDKILNKNITYVNQLDNEFSSFCFKLENIIQGYVKTLLQNNNKLSAILSEQKKDNNKYFYDLLELSKYIKCKYFKNSYH